jgi:hypothetical protein
MTARPVRAKGHADKGKVMIVARLDPDQFKIVADYAQWRGWSVNRVLAAAVKRCADQGLLTPKSMQPDVKPNEPTKEYKHFGFKNRAAWLVWNDLPDGEYSYQSVAREARTRTGQSVFEVDVSNAVRNRPEMFRGLRKKTTAHKRVLLIKETPK